jgi:hypothetical protein
MTLPNVNEWMTSLSALQIVPPPKHHENGVSSDALGNEPSVPPLPPAYCPEQRDDAPTSTKPQSKHSKLAKIEEKNNSSNGDRDGITEKATTAKKRMQTSLSRRRGDEITTPSSFGATPNSNYSNTNNIKRSSKINCPDGNTNRNMIMVGTQRVYPRTLVQPTIYHNNATDLWIATIHTDSNIIPTASDISTTETKSKQKAFSFHDEKSARASAYANSPPILIPFGTTTQCMLCDTSFTFLRRPKHCKNCGIIICADCSTRWNVKMLPETYNNKSTLGLSKSVRVCVSCDAVAKRFKNALMMGRYDIAVEGYLTGNVNLRCPFVFKGEREIM